MSEIDPITLSVLAGRMEQIADENKQKSKKELEKIYGLIDEPNSWGAVGVFVGKGIKA